MGLRWNICPCCKAALTFSSRLGAFRPAGVSCQNCGRQLAPTTWAGGIGFLVSVVMFGITDTVDGKPLATALLVLAATFALVFLILFLAPLSPKRS